MPRDLITRNDHLQAASKSLADFCEHLMAAEKLSPAPSPKMEQLDGRGSLLKTEFDIEAGLTR